MKKNLILSSFLSWKKLMPKAGNLQNFNCRVIRFTKYEWSNNYSNTNGVTKSPTAPQEAMLQLCSWMILGLTQEHSSPWRVPVEKQQQQDLPKHQFCHMTFLYNFAVSIYNCSALSYDIFESVSLVRENLRRLEILFFINPIQGNLTLLQRQSL